jgi:tetratricopeptide (TPR) repeat protein
VQWAWLYETAIIMLVINYLNLLPFVPLDGGHIVRLTIMERFPTGKLLFTGFSVVAFAAGGWFLGEPIFWVLAVIMLISLPWSALEAGVLNELYQQPLLLDDLDKKGKLKLLFETLKQPRFHKLNFSQKYDLAKSLSEVLLQPQHLGRLGTLGLAGAYIGALLLTPPAIMVTTVGVDNAYNIVALMHGNHPIKDWDTEIAQAESAIERFDVMLDASQFYIATSNLPKALRYLEQAETTFSVINNDSALARLYLAYSQLYRQQQDLPQAESYLQKIIKLHRQTPEQYSFELANDYQTLATIYSQQNKQQDLESVLNDGLGYALKVKNPEQRYLITTLTGQLMDLYYRQQQFKQAEKVLGNILPELQEYKDPLNKQITNYIYQELGWLFVTKKDPDTAMDYFSKALSLSTGTKEPLTTLSGLTDEIDNNSAANMTTIDLLLALTAVQYEKGNMSIAQSYLQKATELIKLNYFESLDQYIGTYTTSYQTDDINTTPPRDAARWHLISEAHQYFTPKKTAAVN